MSTSHVGLQRSEEHRRNLAKALTGKKLSDSHRESLRVSHLGHKHTMAQREKISLSMTKHLQSGGKHFGYVTGSLDTRFGKIRYRSALERDFLRKAQADESILFLKYEPVILPYQDSAGVNRHYLPDYLVLARSGGFLVEVKPAGLVSYNQAKADCARAWAKNHADFIFITENEIRAPSSTLFPWATTGATAATQPVAGQGVKTKSEPCSDVGRQEEITCPPL